MLVLDWDLEDLEAIRDSLAKLDQATRFPRTATAHRLLNEAWEIAYGAHLLELVNKAIEEAQ